MGREKAEYYLGRREGEREKREREGDTHRQRERERDGDTHRQRERERERNLVPEE